MDITVKESKKFEAIREREFKYVQVAWRTYIYQSIEYMCGVFPIREDNCKKIATEFREKFVEALKLNCKLSESYYLKKNLWKS